MSTVEYSEVYIGKVLWTIYLVRHMEMSRGIMGSLYGVIDMSLKGQMETVDD